MESKEVSIHFSTRQSGGPARRVSLGNSFRHVDAKAHPLIFENNGDSINNTYAGVGFAMDNNLVLELLGPIRVRKMFFRQSVVPPAIPSDQKIGVFLECSSQLSASKFLNVEISVGVGVGTKRHLCVSIYCCDRERR